MELELHHVYDWLTRANKANLAKLATHLEHLPEDYEHFEMEVFTSMPTEIEAEYGLNNGGVAKYPSNSDNYPCGTVACAVGHGPAAGILMRKGLDVTNYWGDGYHDICWTTYSERFNGGSGIIDRWLFSGEWSAADNTHRGAAARIRYLLDRKPVPEVLVGGYYEAKSLYQDYIVKGDDHIDERLRQTA